MTKSVGIAWLAALALTACAGGRHSRTCEWPAETARSLDLTRAGDREHLRRDAESAETIAIHYADVAPARTKGTREYAQARDDCMESLFGAVSRNHGVDIAIVRAFRTRRNRWLDAMVLISFALAYASAAYALAGLITRRFAADGWPAAGIAVVIVSLAAAVTGLLFLDLWTTAAENIRLGTSHLSYRTERLPGRTHRALWFAAGVALFWLISALRYRRAVSR